MDNLSKLYPIMEHARFIYENRNEIIKKPFILLRPVEKGVTIYSLEAEHPMRGNSVKCEITKINQAIKDAEFEDRGKVAANGFREDDVQARFGLGLINDEEQFEGIKFVTTEFLLEKANKRIDVLGVKEDTLYIFELKKSTTNKVFEQMEAYKKELSADYEKTYQQILKYYPNMQERYITKFEAIAVMPWSEHTKLKNENMWLYEVPFCDKMIFHKF